MKIKCPFCDIWFNDDKDILRDKLLGHIIDCHPLEKLIDIIFKIHEKIEEKEEHSRWTDEALKKVGMYSEEYESTARYENNLVIKELRFLLENEK